MKRALFVCVMLSVFCAAAAGQRASSKEPSSTFISAGADKIDLKKDLRIITRSKDAVSTATAKVGDVVQFVVVKQVKADDLVIIEKGAIATARVAEIRPPARKRRSAYIRFEFEDVQLVTGEKAPIICHFDLGGDAADPTRNAMMGFAGMLATMANDSLYKGGQTEMPEGVRVPVWIAASTTVSTADLKAHQPAPQPKGADSFVYLFLDPPEYGFYEVKYLVGESHYFLQPQTAVRIQVPPGDYWLRSGKAAKDERIAKAKPADLTHVTVKAGESYYFTADRDPVDKKNFLLRSVPETEAEEHLANVERIWPYPVEKNKAEMLVKLQAQPPK